MRGSRPALRHHQDQAPNLPSSVPKCVGGHQKDLPGRRDTSVLRRVSSSRDHGHERECGPFPGLQQEPQDRSALLWRQRGAFFKALAARLRGEHVRRVLGHGRLSDRDDQV